MTPKEKAKELYVRYAVMWHASTNDVKQCALIAVNEMINMCKLYHNHNVVIDTKIYTKLTIKYWQEVKQEIELL